MEVGDVHVEGVRDLRRTVGTRKRDRDTNIIDRKRV